MPVMLRCLMMATVLAASVLSTRPGLAATYAVVVGIDDYEAFSDLEGAVNDAEDLTSVLRSRGADVEVLLNDAATRIQLIRAFRGQLAKAVSGDVVILTFAGHGIQFTEARAGDEADGKDESFALHGFALSGAGVAEQLRDNDLAQLFAEAPQGVSIFFVADSCHSGTMTRGGIGEGMLGKTRYLNLGPIRDNPFTEIPDTEFQKDPDSQPHVVFASAARDNELTPEVLIDGKRRGALSWTVARAFERDMQSGGGIGNLTDLRQYVRAQVRALSGARQTPDVTFTAGAEETLGGLLLSAPQDGSAAPDDTPAGPRNGPMPTVHIMPRPLPDGSAILGEAVSVETEDEADLVWDRATGVIIDRRSADLLAEAAHPDTALAAIRKWRAVAGLSLWTPRRAFDLTLHEGDGRHFIGDALTFIASLADTEMDAGYLTLFNFASTGEIQFIYPDPADARRGRDLVRRNEMPLIVGPASVTEPVGADHLIGIVTTTPPTAMRSALEALDGTTDMDAVFGVLAEHAGDPANARIAVLPLFTARSP
jgi:hypothetical protein